MLPYFSVLLGVFVCVCVGGERVVVLFCVYFCLTSMDYKVGEEVQYCFPSTILRQRSKESVIFLTCIRRSRVDISLHVTVIFALQSEDWGLAFDITDV